MNDTNTYAELLAIKDQVIIAKSQTIAIYKRMVEDLEAELKRERTRLYVYRDNLVNEELHKAGVQAVSEIFLNRPKWDEMTVEQIYALLKHEDGHRKAQAEQAEQPKLSLEDRVNSAIKTLEMLAKETDDFLNIVNIPYVLAVLKGEQEPVNDDQ